MEKTYSERPDPECLAELARFLRQEQVVTKGMGGLFPESADLSQVQTVLDLACGCGGWALEVANVFSNKQVVGIDIDERRIAFANAQAERLQQPNANFRVMNILQPLDFPDASFDLVNARLIGGFVRPDQWPTLLREVMRILRPGGVIQLTDVEWGLSNKPAVEKAYCLINQAMHKVGATFSPNGIYLGLLPMLPRLLSDAGGRQVCATARVIEFSADTPAHESFFSDAATLFREKEPLVETMLNLSQEEAQEAFQKALAEMNDDDFCGMWMLLTASGLR